MTMRKILSAAAVCAALLFTFSVRADDKDKDKGGEKLKAHLSGFYEVPVMVSGGTATFHARVADDDQSFDWELTYSFPATSTVTQSHIHVGGVGVSGNIVLFLCTNLGNANPAGTTVAACPTPAGTVTGTATGANVVSIPAQGFATGDFAGLLGAIRAGSAYVNIHTAAHPPGEIRGQVHDH
jgi:hypothetical protein